MARAKKKKQRYVSFTATNLRISSKIILIVLVFAMIFSSLNVAALAKFLNKGEDNVDYTFNEVDLSSAPNILEVEDLRTENSKTFLKQTGIYETEYYQEAIHYYKDGEYLDIDNTLTLIDKKYINKGNKFTTSFPKLLNDNEKIELSYLDYPLSIKYENLTSKNGELASNISREKKNLKDGIIYETKDSKIEYIVKQNSLKENIILNKYIPNYEFSYIIETPLRIEKLNNELYFYDENTLIYHMSPYNMLDANGNLSYDITFSVNNIGDNSYRVAVSPSENYLKNAAYPVIIDPEISISEGGILDWVFTVSTVDKLTREISWGYMGNFTINNRNNSISSDDKNAYFHVTIPQHYDASVSDRIINNQFMYAYLTLPTEQIVGTGDAYTNLSIVNSQSTEEITADTVFNTTRIDSQFFHTSTAYEHKYNIYDTIVSRFDQLAVGDVHLTFELSVSGTNNTSVTYSLGAELTGPKPVVRLGYLDDAGLSSYYTYESLPVDKSANVYIAHNSGNLAYIFNNYNDNNLLNFSHIFNTNRIKGRDSIYGTGFSINYNERIEHINNYFLTLIEGDGREVSYISTNQERTEYIARDGSGDKINKILNGYELISSSGSFKIYNEQGLLITIYPNNNDRDENGIFKPNANKITIDYTNNRISKVSDNYGNYIAFTYNSSVNYFPKPDQFGKEYLANVTIHRYDPETSTTTGVIMIMFEYLEGNLIDIYSENMLSGYEMFRSRSISYNDKNQILNINSSEGQGYTFTYDSQNRVTKAKALSYLYDNGNYLDFIYDKNGKKTTITDGLGFTTKYTFDNYYHTNSIENSNGYTTFYKYTDIFFNEDGTYIISPNYNLNHKIIRQSNTFKNNVNPLNNHGFEINTSSSNIYGWQKEVTNNSTANIQNSILLYGSKVLELYKSNTGTAKVYQDINVISGKDYIVTGYIKNENSLGNGAYISVTPISGTFSNISSSTKVKSSNEFIYFEYKFKANYNGRARINLINESNGNSYFDQIGVNHNYIDTRYNYLENASFENVLTNGWSYNGVIRETRNSNYFNSNSGEYSVKFVSSGSLSQSINIIGSANDIFVFGGYCFYENHTGNVTVSARIDYLDNKGSDTVVFKFDPKNLNTEYMMEKVQAKYDYYKVTLTILNSSDSSYAYLDNIALYKEGYGINVSYNDDGLTTSESNEITSSVTSYNYDDNKNITAITTNNDRTDFGYDENQNLNLVANNNVISEFEIDDNGNYINTKTTADDSDVKYLSGSTEYTTDGLYPKSSKDIFGNITTYTYDYLTGLVKSVVDSNGVETEYEYDASNRPVAVMNGKGSNVKLVTYTYDSKGNLTSITTEDLTYNLTYNNYGDLKSISVGGKTLLTNHYKGEDSSEIYTGEIDRTDYSYGTVSFDYNNDGQIEKIYHNSVLVLSYLYNDYNEIASYTDHKENLTYYYNYDYQNRLINVNCTNGNNISYSYDSNSHLVNKTNINGSNEYGYDDDDKLINEYISDVFRVNYGYSNDSFANLDVINYYVSTSPITRSYEYETIQVDNETINTGRIASITYTINNDIIEYDYSYDQNNNIIDISGYKNSSLIYSETNEYDVFGQITYQMIMAEDVEIFNEYQYDLRGNITSYESTDLTNDSTIYFIQFLYRQDGFKDELVMVFVNEQRYDITYSTTGQPNKYLGWNIQYDMRSIGNLYNNDYYIEYEYNADGIRIGKFVYNKNSQIIDSVKYVLNDNQIVKEIHNGDLVYEINYYYDSSNNVIGFTYNNHKYMYLKNLQNDVMGIVDENNNIIVKYYYDAYGNIINTIDDSNINLSKINRFTYRSYYQDEETGWYYLNSRYYNPLSCRFVTMDDIGYLGASGTILSYNLFSYCENNPVNNVDPLGNLSIPRWTLSVPLDILFWSVLSPVSTSWATVTQPIKSGAKKLGNTFVKTTFKNGLLKMFNIIKNAMIKISSKIVPIIKKAVGWLFKKWTQNLTATSFTTMIIGALLSFTANSILDSILSDITILLSLGGLIAGLIDWATDNKLDGWIKLDFWR